MCLMNITTQNLSVMDKKENKKENFISYEEARIDQGKVEYPEPVTDKEVNTAVEIVNPDENSMDSRG